LKKNRSWLGEFAQHLALLTGLQRVQNRLIMDSVDVWEALDITRSVADFFMKTNRYQAAIEFYKELLTLVKVIENSASSSLDVVNMGIYHALASAYFQLGNYDDSKANAKLALRISKQRGHKNGERTSYYNLCSVFDALGRSDKIVKYLEKALQISTETEAVKEEAEIFCELGRLYYDLGQYEKSKAYELKSIKLSKEIGHRQNEARSLSYLSKAFISLGKVKESVQKLEEALKICEEIGDDSMGASILLLLGAACRQIRQFDKAMEHYLKSLRVSQQMHDSEKEGKACCHLGTFLAQLQEYDKAIKYLEKALEISNLTGDRVTKEEVCNAFVDIYRALDQPDKATEYARQAMESISEAGTREYKRSSALIRVAEGYATAGNIQQACDVLAESVRSYEKEIEPLSDELKLSVGDKTQSIAGYKSHCGVLIALGRVLDALCTAERGRAGVLGELLAKKYAIQEKVEFSQDSLGDLIGSLTKEQILVFIAVLHNVTVFWVMTNKAEHKLKITSRKEACEEDVHNLLENILHGNFRSLAGDREMECEDRSLSAFYDPGSLGDRLVESDNEEDEEANTPNQLYNMLIAPFADHAFEGREVVLVPEGSMFMVPFSSLQNDSGQYLCDICKIRILPSLTTLKLIYDCSADYHSDAGALIVGDPDVSRVTRLQPLPAARQEAKEIADLLNVSPLLGEQAIKREVLRNITDVCLIHIAAHGDAERGEIACAPNPSSSQVLRKEDFMLSMEDIAKVGIRAKLVVLSCCHSGRGKIMKAEGVVGIARAFIASGARSVLVSLWLLNDESTKEFMIRFYKHLVCDKLSASEALHQSIKWMRQSKKYNNVRDWAPFVLIGDDVKLDF